MAAKKSIFDEARVRESVVVSVKVSVDDYRKLRYLYEEEKFKKPEGSGRYTFSMFLNELIQLGLKEYEKKHAPKK